MSLQNAAQRYIYYERQLGKKDNEINLPELSEMDAEGLLKLKFRAKEPSANPRNIAVDIAQDLGEAGGKIVSSHEAQELEKLASARDLQDVVQGIRLGGQAISLLPQFGIKFHFWGLGGDANYGGFNLGKIAQFAADVVTAVADRKIMKPALPRESAALPAANRTGRFKATPSPAKSTRYSSNCARRKSAKLSPNASGRIINNKSNTPKRSNDS